MKLRVQEPGAIEAVWIDEAFLDKQLAAVRYWVRRLERAVELPLD